MRTLLFIILIFMGCLVVGCSFSGLVEEDYRPKPKAIAGEDQTVVAGDYFTLQGDYKDSSNIHAVLWSEVIKDSFVSVSSVNKITRRAPLKKQKMRFCFEVENSYGQKDSDYVSIDVIPGKPKVFAGNDTTFVEGSSVTLTGEVLETGGDIKYYSWIVDNKEYKKLKNPEVTFTVPSTSKKVTCIFKTTNVYDLSSKDTLVFSVKKGWTTTFTFDGDPKGMAFSSKGRGWAIVMGEHKPKLFSCLNDKWEYYLPSAGLDKCSAISFSKNEDECYIVGGQEARRWENNVGIWTSVKDNLFGSAFPMIDVAVNSKDDVWILCEKNSLLHKVKNEWKLREVPIVSQQGKDQLHFIDTKNGWIMSDQEIYRYNGTSWKKESIDIGPPYTLINMTMTSAVTGWVTVKGKNGEGKMLKYDPRGQFKWTVHTEDMGLPLKDHYVNKMVLHNEKGGWVVLRSEKNKGDKIYSFDGKSSSFVADLDNISIVEIYITQDGLISWALGEKIDEKNKGVILRWK